MKKNIVIGVLILTNLLFLLYAFQKKSEAADAIGTALQLQMLAEEQAAIANECKQQALEAQRLAEVNLEKALQEGARVKAEIEAEKEN